MSGSFLNIYKQMLMHTPTDHFVTYAATKYDSSLAYTISQVPIPTVVNQ